VRFHARCFLCCSRIFLRFRFIISRTQTNFFFIMYTQAHQSKSSKRVLKVAQTLKRTRPLLMCACQKRDGAETLCVDVRDSRTDRLISATVLIFCDSRATDKIWRQNVQNYYFGFSRQILAIQFVYYCSWAVFLSHFYSQISSKYSPLLSLIVA